MALICRLGVGGFFFLFFWGGGESCSIQVDCKGDHDQSSSTEYMSGNNRKLTIYLLPVEGGGGGESGGGGGHTNITEIYGEIR